MSNTKQQIWHSGDWERSGKNPNPPFNGLEISAVSTYGTITSPPSPRKLFSIDLTVTDFTYDPNGVSSTITISKTGVWCAIPIPMDNTVSPPTLNSKFTVTSISGGGPGMVRIDATPSGTFLNIQFRYGLEHMTREEIGYIMRFDLGGGIEVEK